MNRRQGTRTQRHGARNRVAFQEPSSLRALIAQMEGSPMKRREFFTLLGGAVVARPLAARAQQAGKVKRIGFLRVGPPPASFIDGFRQGLRELGFPEDQTSLSSTAWRRVRHRSLTPQRSWYVAE